MNSVNLIGNLVREPELSYTQNQTAKCMFTIAVNRPRRNGEDQGADFLRIVTWGQRAEHCNRYLAKGKKVGVHGAIRTGSYKDRNGATVYTTDVWADNVEFLTPSNQQPAQQQSYAAQPAQAQAPAPDLQPQQTQLGFDDLPDSFSAAEEDIPF